LESDFRIRQVNHYLHFINIMVDASAASTTSGNPEPQPTLQSSSAPLETQVFVAERCLFCNKSSMTFESNLLHMQTLHGLFIPDKGHLIVDLETLIEYLHLVIHGYNECIYCGTQRGSPQAAQQHMMGKGHCRIDIADQGSEFADFYDFSEAEDEDQDDSEVEIRNGLKSDKKTVGQAIQPDDNSLRLSSGKIISKSSASQPHTQRKARSHSANIQSHIEDGSSALESDQPSSPLSPSRGVGRGGLALTRSEKRDNAFATQLSRLSANDRNSLAHLPTAEQRTILTTQQKQAEKSRRAERRYQSRVEGLGNKTLMKHFVPDTPGRSNG
jgi:pre-60S factor REI1